MAQRLPNTYRGVPFEIEVDGHKVVAHEGGDSRHGLVGSRNQCFRCPCQPVCPKPSVLWDGHLPAMPGHDRRSTQLSSLSGFCTPGYESSDI